MARLLFSLLLCTFFSLGFSQGEIEDIINKASLVYDENPAESFSLCERAERKANETGNHSEDGHINVCKARYYILIAKYDAASKELNEAIITFQETEDLLSLAGVYSLKNILLAKMGKLDESHKHLVKSYEIRKEIGDTYGMINALTNLCLDYYRIQDADSMLFCLQQLEQKTKEFDESQFYYYYQNWGTYYLLTEDYVRALQQYRAALEVAEEQKMTDSKATCLMYIAQTYRKDNQLDQAEKFIEESYTFSEQNNLIYESYEALQEWIEISLAKGDFEMAFESQSKWIRLEKEINDIQRLQKVQAMESQLEIVEKEKEIAEGQVALKESNLEGQRAKTRNAWLFGVVIIVIILLSFTVFIYIKTRKLNQTIQHQKEEVELKSLKLEDALSNIHDSLAYSKMIQSSMLPSVKSFEQACADHFVLYKPKDIVSGDFYWMHEVEGYTVIAVGDCTGHGVPGAMVSMVCHEALNKVIIEQEQTDPGKALDLVRDIVTNTFARDENNMNDGMDISLIMKKGNQLFYAGANNNLWLYREKKEMKLEQNDIISIKEMESCFLIEVKSDKQPVGNYHDPKPFNTKELTLEEGDKIYLFSDGFADQFGGEKGKKLKSSNFKLIIGKSYPLSMSDQGTHLKNIFEEWKGELEQIDDVCIIGLRF